MHRMTPLGRTHLPPGVPKSGKAAALSAKRVFNITFSGTMIVLGALYAAIDRLVAMQFFINTTKK